MATANVLRDLPGDAARSALAKVLEAGPDLVGLQEWGLRRLGLLRHTGDVRLAPGTWVTAGRARVLAAPTYTWSAPVVGGCAVGARSDRFELVHCRSVLLSGPRRSDNPTRQPPVEPPRIATVATYRDQRENHLIHLVDYHLAPGVQADGRYDPDRPLVAANHRRQVQALQRIVDSCLQGGAVVYAVGDSNFHGLRLQGLTSAWEGRQDSPGTLGATRKVDDVHGPGPATSVTLVETGSDHKAVVVARPA